MGQFEPMEIGYSVYTEIPTSLHCILSAPSWNFTTMLHARPLRPRKLVFLFFFKSNWTGLNFDLGHCIEQ
jgi:hypothetical protein